MQIKSLNELQVQEFHRNGFVVIKNFLAPDNVDRLRAYVNEICAWPELPSRHMVYYEDDLRRPDNRIVSRIENFCPYHRELDTLFNGARVLHEIGRLFGASPVMFKDKINFKRPGGDGFKAHQDVQAGWDKYAELHITLLISVDRATTENGCLEIAPAMHRAGLLGEMWQPLADPDPRISYVSCETEPGDAVFFDSFIPHRSGPNLTDEQRRVLYVTYNKAVEGDHRANYYNDKRVSYPPDCERKPCVTYNFKV